MNLNIDTLILESGAHDNPEDGMCIMEAVAYISGEPFTDSPSCVCPVLGAFLRSWNDSLDNDNRQRLKPYIPLLVGTNDGNSNQRSWMFLDWLVRVCTPEFLSVAGFGDHASILRALTEITDTESITLAQTKLDAAMAAARASAMAAARASAMAAARASAMAAAMAAARASARASAMDAARASAMAAARASAMAAAWSAAWSAAMDAAMAAADLEPIIARLQTSAFNLLDRMIAL
jgi:hypothetical protein